MKYEAQLKWTNKKLDELSKELSEECMVCNFVRTGNEKLATDMYNKKSSPELFEKKRDFRKKTDSWKFNQRSINKRLTQMTMLQVSYRTVLVDHEATSTEKTIAKEKMVELNRIKNLYYANMQDFISNMNVNTKAGEDWVEIVLFAFVPASFMTGYFGMNFTSMGNPGKNYNPYGILTSKYGHYLAIALVVFFCVLSYYVVSNSFFNADAEKIKTIKKFNELLNMPTGEDYLDSTNFS